MDKDVVLLAEYLISPKELIILNEEMPNITADESGLRRHVFISSKSFGGKDAQHGPRIKVSNIKGKFDRSDNFTMSISHDPTLVAGKARGVSAKELSDISDWIKRHHDHLMDVWEGRKTADDFIEHLKNKKDGN